MNLRRRKCLVLQSVRNPKAVFRWLRMNWMRRVKVTEKEIGGEIQAC